MQNVSDRAELLLRLRNDIAACRRMDSEVETSAIRTGWPALDRVLPFGGIPRGSLVELLDVGPGGGAESVAAALTVAACRRGGAVVVIDRERRFYPPALAAWQVTYERMVVVRATSDATELWAADQAPRSSAVAAVWLRRDRLIPHDVQRLRLAAAEGGTLGVLIRPLRQRGQLAWAGTQLLVEPQPGSQGRRLSVTVTRCRSGIEGRQVDIEIGDDGDSDLETPPVPKAAELARPAAAS